MKLIWSLTDFRAWWDSAARCRWRRVVHSRASMYTTARDLTNFGDIR